MESHQHLSIRLGFSQAFINDKLQPGFTQAAFGNSFTPTTATPARIVDHALAGKALTVGYFKGNTRTNETFISMQLFVLDLEAPDVGDVTVADVVASPIGQYVLAAFPSKSSGKVTSSNPHGYKRTRALILVSEAVPGVERARVIATAIGAASGLKGVDKASFKPAQPYYGSTNRIEQPYVNLDAVMPISVAGALTRDHALDEMLRALAPKLPTIKPSTEAHYSWIERKSARRVENALSQMASACKSERHDMLVKLAPWLYGLKKGGWTVSEHDIAALQQTALNVMGEGREQEIKRVLRWAEQHAEAVPLELPVARVPELRIVKKLQPAEVAGETSIYYHSAGEPRAWLIAICHALPRNKNLVKVVRLLWASYRVGLLNPEDFVMQQLLEARTTLGMKLADGTLKDNFKLLEELFWRVNTKRQDAFTNQNKSQMGPPKQHFRALPLVEIEGLLARWAAPRIEEQWYVGTKTTPNLNPQMTDALDGDARRAALEVMPLLSPASEEARRAGRNARQDLGALVRSLKDCTPVTIPLDCEDVRAALFAAENNPDEAKGYRDIMREYGVSIGNVKKFVGRAGYRVVKQSVDCAITSADTFEQELSEARKVKRGFPVGLIERNGSGDEVEHPFSPTHSKANRAVIETAQQAGNSVYVRLRTKSKYVASDAVQAQVEGDQPIGVRQARRNGMTVTRPHYGVGYNPDIVLRWLKTHLRFLKWRELPGDRFVNPATGEMFDLSEKDFLTFATSLAESLGAVILEMA